VEVCRTPDGEIVEFVATGHAGSGPYGHDLVCSAVSAVVQTAVCGLKEVLDLRPMVEQKSGFLRCRLAPAEQTAEEREKGQVVLATMVAGLKGIAASYPGYLVVKERTV